MKTDYALAESDIQMMGWVDVALSGGWESAIFNNYSGILFPPPMLLSGYWLMGNGQADDHLFCSYNLH